MTGTSKPAKPCLYFITPVFERYELTAISLKQKVDAITQLEANGINAACVVIGDDDNITTAKELGLATVIRQNDYLGAKFNDGHEYAAKHGATYVAPVGSDSWMDPKWLFNSLPSTRAVLASKHYAIVHKTGIKRCQIFIPLYVSYVIPVKLLKDCDYRPIYEKRHKGCDTNTMESIESSKPGGPVRRLYSKDSHLLDTVAFQSPMQITDYDRIYGKWGVSQTFDPFGDLKEHYPAELVDEIEAFYAIDNEETSYELLERMIPHVKRMQKNGHTESLLFEIEACLVKRERELSNIEKSKDQLDVPRTV